MGPAERSDILSRISNLIAHAAIQDSLLQSYRQILLTTQSIFLAIATMSLIEALKSNPKEAYGERIIPFLLLIICLSVNSLGWLISARFKSVIKNRGKWVSYFHIKIMEAERSLQNKNRDFTNYKLAQLPAQRKKGEDGLINTNLPKDLTDSDIREIIEEDKKITRLVIDKCIDLIEHLFTVIIALTVSVLIVLSCLAVYCPQCY